MKIKRSILILLTVFGLYLALYFAVMDWDVPAWKDGRFVNTCAVRWGKERPVVRESWGLTFYVRPWHPLNVVFGPAEDIVNALPGRGGHLELVRVLNEQFELRAAYWRIQELIHKGP